MTAPRTARGPGEVELVIRPLRVRIVAWVVAVFLVAFFTVGAVLARVGDSGFSFRLADQISMVALGLILGGAALLFTRPRVRAGRAGVEVRAAVLTRTVPWDDVLSVSFPDGQQFARLELPDDEYLPVAAIQAIDRGRAARDIRALRALHATHSPHGTR